MSHRLPCPNGHVLVIPPKLEGKRIKCPKCQTLLEVPIMTAAEDEEEIITEAAEEEVPKPPPLAKSGIKKGPPPPPRARRDEDDNERRPRNRFRDDEDDEAPRRRRKPVDEDDDEDDDRPRSRRRRDDDDFDDDDDDRPRSRRAKKKRRKSASAFGNISEGKAVLIGCGAMLLFVALGFVVPVFALIPMLAGLALTLSGAIWFLVLVFKENPLAGVLCTVVPFYSLVYLLMHLDELKKPFLYQMAGILLTSLSAVPIEYSKKNQLPPNKRGENSDNVLITSAGASIHNAAPQWDRVATL